MAGANKIIKEKKVSDLKTKFSNVTAAIVTQFQGINVEKITQLRADLRKGGIKLEVIKNKISSRAVEGTPLEALKPHFKGPTAVAYSSSDPVALAKALRSFAEKEEKFLIQAGVLEGTLLDKGQVIELAKVPSREVLLARLVGSMQNSYASFVYLLGAITRKVEASSTDSANEEVKS